MVRFFNPIPVLALSLVLVVLPQTCLGEDVEDVLSEVEATLAATPASHPMDGAQEGMPPAGAGISDTITDLGKRAGRQYRQIESAAKAGVHGAATATTETIEKGVKKTQEIYNEGKRKAAEAIESGKQAAYQTYEDTKKSVQQTGKDIEQGAREIVGLPSP